MSYILFGLAFSMTTVFIILQRKLFLGEREDPYISSDLMALVALKSPAPLPLLWLSGIKPSGCEPGPKTSDPAGIPGPLRDVPLQLCQATCRLAGKSYLYLVVFSGQASRPLGREGAL